MAETRVRRGEMEDRVTGTIESQTSRLPSFLFLAGALGSIAASAILQAFRKDHWALFVGQWAPTFLILGTYNKMVKQHGSDWASKGERVA